MLPAVAAAAIIAAVVAAVVATIAADTDFVVVVAAAAAAAARTEIAVGSAAAAARTPHLVDAADIAFDLVVEGIADGLKFERNHLLLWPVDSHKSAVVGPAALAAGPVVAAAAAAAFVAAAKAFASSSAPYSLYPSFELQVQHSKWPALAIPVPWNVAKLPDRPLRLDHEWRRERPLSMPVWLRL